jgi:hypothetical protein
MKRALLVLLFAASVVAMAQDPKAKPAPAAKPSAAPVAKPAAVAAPTKTTGAILANKDSKTYHRADCKSAAKIKDANKTTFASAAEADKAGYKACKVCKP